MRILRKSNNGDWEPFTEGNDLQAIADLAQEPVNRYAFHLEDLQIDKEKELDKRFYNETLADFGGGPEALLLAFSAKDTDPKKIRLRNRAEQLERDKVRARIASSQEDLDKI